VLERIGSPPARAVLESLANAMPGTSTAKDTKATLKRLKMNAR
jgi:hypothetical protein